MKKCSNAQHPHCTYWVMPGATTCEGGHTQPAPSSFDLLSAMRTARASSAGTALDAAPAEPAPNYARPVQRAQSDRPQLHISGFDPRAAGGRQALKMTLRGMPEGCAPELVLQLQSDLIPNGASQQSFVRASGGEWRPVFAEFSSRGKEHGQYQISIELTSRHTGLATRKWVCTFVILVPRPDATLTEIHRIFLSTHKNVRVMADDAAIARVSAPDGHSVDIDVTARNAGIAQLDLGASAGKVDLSFPTIAWDEDLIEIDMPQGPAVHPHPSRAASLVNAAPEAGTQRQVRLFALDECVLGRFELVDPEANLLLTHYTPDGQDSNGLTRRLSGRHAVIRRAGAGFEIEDVSRYGILLDGVWPGKHKPTTLRLGMRIELTASIKGIVVLTVSAIMPHGVILHRLDHGASAECYYLLMPETHPGYPLKAYPATPQAAALPILLHRDGGFWHLDQVTGKETALAPTTPLDKLSRIARPSRFASDPYPEHWIIRTHATDLYETVAAGALSTA
ncbi:FHA domain-containing protein [Pseudoduganella danionis]|uniref:FHA domain-containing protein n=1 Tax=Pseudoduganella danionis TaxID=1890295 RepID=A0ABW9SN42_9BURK|nr:FHA domain-containing protein [Pseudoduganella danionis]MTW32638.1 FHA domain-containing protein [Pseudoduganella danionis]